MSADGLTGFSSIHAQTVWMRYPSYVNHLEVLRDKIGRLRMEIAQIQGLNEEYRRVHRNGPDAHVAHGLRHERLQAIQQELSQLAGLGRKVRSIEEMKEKHRSRMHLVKEVAPTTRAS
jgi:hypothetical protein